LYGLPICQSAVWRKRTMAKPYGLEGLEAELGGWSELNAGSLRNWSDRDGGLSWQGSELGCGRTKGAAWDQSGSRPKVALNLARSSRGQLGSTGCRSEGSGYWAVVP